MREGEYTTQNKGTAENWNRLLSVAYSSLTFAELSQRSLTLFDRNQRKRVENMLELAGRELIHAGDASVEDGEHSRIEAFRQQTGERADLPERRRRRPRRGNRQLLHSRRRDVRR